MVALQIISQILNTKDNSIIDNNLLTVDYFVGYEEEYNYIQDHYKKYGNVPDKASFLAQFPAIELVEVNESERYLVDTIREEYLYYKSIPVVQKIAELLKTDANAAAEYMVTAIKDLQPDYKLGGVDIIADAETRYNQFIERQNNQDEWFFTTGFPELDEIVHGIHREEELFVIFARVNQGKSWILEKICSHVWQLGFNIGYISPEMSASSIGYRFDTLYKNFSNKGLMWGNNSIDSNMYHEYIKSLQNNPKKFIVATPLDFDKKITVLKLKNWITQYKLDMIAVDGITYLTDERAKRGDNKTISLTNISEDLMSLSMEMKVPILIVVQANRGGVIDGNSEGTPELENIRDSDGIAHNASKVISIRQKENGILEIGIKKQRFGSVGGKLIYNWNIDTGDFEWVPGIDDAVPKEKKEEKISQVKRNYKDKTEVF